MGGLLYAELCSEEREDSVFFKDNMGLECGSTAENLACSRPWDPDPVSGSNSNHNHKQLLLGKKQLPCPKDLHVDSLEKLQMDRREAENQGVLWGVGVGPG